MENGEKRNELKPGESEISGASLPGCEKDGNGKTRWKDHPALFRYLWAKAGGISGYGPAFENASTNGCCAVCLLVFLGFGVVGFLSGLLEKTYHSGSYTVVAIAAGFLVAWVPYKVMWWWYGRSLGPLREEDRRQMASLLEDHVENDADPVGFLARFELWCDEVLEGDPELKELYLGISKRIGERMGEGESIAKRRRALEEGAKRKAAHEAKETEEKLKAEAETAIARMVPDLKTLSNGLTVPVGRYQLLFKQEGPIYRTAASFNVRGTDEFLVIRIGTETSQDMGLSENQRKTYQVKLPWDCVAGVEPYRPVIDNLAGALVGLPTWGYRVKFHIPVPVLDLGGWAACYGLEGTTEIEKVCGPFETMSQQRWSPAPGCPKCGKFALAAESGFGIGASIGWNQPEIVLKCGECRAEFLFLWEKGEFLPRP